MADPFTMAAISMGTTVLGGLTSAAGASAAGKAQSGQYQYQAGVALLNSQIAEQNAEYSRQVGEQKAQQYGMAAGQKFSQIKTAQASSGLDVNSGSAKDVQNSQRLVSQMDMNQIRSTAAKTAYDYETQAQSSRNQSTLYSMGAANASQAGDINVASSLIGSAGSVASKWLQGQQMGLWGGMSGGGGGGGAN